MTQPPECVNLGGMDWKNQCAAVVPCFNEADHIGRVVADIRRKVPNVIVVDDGSTDATARMAAAAGAQVVCLSSNHGKGAALRVGWQRASAQGYNWALTMDGDGQHTAADIPNFFQGAETSHSPLIIGNRMDNPEAMPWLRRQVNRWMSRRLSRMTHTVLPDTQCGFRLLQLGILSRLPLSSHHFEIESETLVAFLAAGYQPKFVPIQVIYKNSASKIHPFIDTCRWFRWRFTNGNPRLKRPDPAATLPTELIPSRAGSPLPAARSHA